MFQQKLFSLGGVHGGGYDPRFHEIQGHSPSPAFIKLDSFGFTCFYKVLGGFHLKSAGFHLKSAGFHLKSGRFHEIHRISCGFHEIHWISCGFHVKSKDPLAKNCNPMFGIFASSTIIILNQNLKLWGTVFFQFTFETTDGNKILMKEMDFTTLEIWHCLQVSIRHLEISLGKSSQFLITTKQELAQLKRQWWIEIDELTFITDYNKVVQHHRFPQFKEIRGIFLNARDSFFSVILCLLC